MDTILISICFHLLLQVFSSVEIAMDCNDTLKTLEVVAECPRNEESWNIAAKKKDCSSKSCQSFKYHCLVSEETASFVEVCTPSLIIHEHHCATFSTESKRISRTSNVKCFVSNCSSTYLSTDIYRYPECLSYNTSTKCFTSDPTCINSQKGSKVDGQWSDFGIFSEWASCSKSCGRGYTERYRERHCNNPPPKNKGKACHGVSVEIQTKSCNSQKCPVNGGWSVYEEFGSWSDCSTLCGIGQKQRVFTRTCSDPLPQYGGKPCNGSANYTESRMCNSTLCPIDGGWSRLEPVSDWSPCSSSCDNGTQMQVKVRRCDNPPPQNGGKTCHGNNFTTSWRRCEKEACPDKWSGYGSYGISGFVVSSVCLLFITSYFIIKRRNKTTKTVSISAKEDQSESTYMHYADIQESCVLNDMHYTDPRFCALKDISMNFKKSFESTTQPVLQSKTTMDKNEDNLYINDKSGSSSMTSIYDDVDNIIRTYDYAENNIGSEIFLLDYKSNLYTNSLNFKAEKDVYENDSIDSNSSYEEPIDKPINEYSTVLPS